MGRTVKTVNIKIGHHPDTKDVVILRIENTGINLENKDHLDYMHALVNFVAKSMYEQVVEYDYTDLNTIIDGKEATNG